MLHSRQLRREYPSRRDIVRRALRFPKRGKERERGAERGGGGERERERDLDRERERMRSQHGETLGRLRGWVTSLANRAARRRRPDIQSRLGRSRRLYVSSFFWQSRLFSAIVIRNYRGSSEIRAIDESISAPIYLCAACRQWTDSRGTTREEDV